MVTPIGSDHRVATMSKAVAEMSNDEVKVLVWAMDSRAAPTFARAYRAVPEAGHLVLRYYNDLYGTEVASDAAGVVREFLMGDPHRHTREAYEMASLL